LKFGEAFILKSDLNIRILISRPDRIGDVVLSTPLPREIKKKYPESFVAVLIRKYTKDIYLNNPYVDEIIVVDENHFFTNLRNIRKLQFTHSLMLLPNEKINWLLLLAGIKYRFGVGHKFYQFLVNTKNVYRRKYIPLRHEADYCMDMIRKFGIDSSNLSTEIFLTDAEKSKAEDLKKSLTENNKLLVGINSTSGNSAPNLRPAEYRNLAGMIIENPGLKLAVTDLDPPEELRRIEGAAYLNINSGLRESIITFSALDILISASTGPMHIAAALKVNTLSLFCPLPACSPQLWEPKGNYNLTILPDQNYCRVICSGDPKDCFFEGTGGINAEKIYQNLLVIIKKLNKNG
jgi:ADP-heptose:LPS heptosyltransferase